MVVAAAVEQDIAYVIRAEDLLRNILLRLGGGTHVWKLLPTNELKDVRVTKLDPFVKMGEYTVDDIVPRYPNSLVAGITTGNNRRGPEDQNSTYASTFIGRHANTTPFSKVGELESQLFDEVQLLRLRERWPAYFVSFLEIPQYDFEACRDWLVRHPGILEIDEDLLLQEAVTAYRLRYKVFAYTSAERMITMRMLKASRRPYFVRIRSYYKALLREDSSEAVVFREEFNKSLEKVKSEGTELASESAPELISNATSPQKRLRLDDRVPKGNKPVHPFVQRPQSHPVKRASEEPNQPLALRGEAYPISSFLGSNVVNERLTYFIQSRPTKPTTLYGLPLINERAFFQVGRVFSMMQPETSGGNPLPASQEVSYPGQHPTANLSMKVMSLVVVRVKHGDSWCVGINNYGGQGCTKPGLSRQDIENHVPIRMVDQKESIQDEEVKRGMTSEYLVVNPSDSAAKFDSRSRVNFGAVYIVEHNQNVLNIGMIDSRLLPILAKYFEDNPRGR